MLSDVLAVGIVLLFFAISIGLIEWSERLR